MQNILPILNPLPSLVGLHQWLSPHVQGSHVESSQAIRYRLLLASLADFV